MAKTSTKVKAGKGTKGAKDKMAKARAARGSGLGSKFAGMTSEALLKVKASTPREDTAAHYAIRRALRAGGYKISENRVAKTATKGKGAAKAAVNKAAKASGKVKAKAKTSKAKASKGGDWEDED